MISRLTTPPSVLERLSSNHDRRRPVRVKSIHAGSRPLRYLFLRFVASSREFFGILCNSRFPKTDEPQLRQIVGILLLIRTLTNSRNHGHCLFQSLKRDNSCSIDPSTNVSVCKRLLGVGTIFMILGHWYMGPPHNCFSILVHTFFIAFAPLPGGLCHPFRPCTTSAGTILHCSRSHPDRGTGGLFFSVGEAFKLVTVASCLDTHCPRGR